MKQRWLTRIVMIGLCLAAVYPSEARAADQAAARPALHLLLNADLLAQPVYAQIQPRLEAFAAATDSGSVAGFGGLTAPGFRLVLRPGADETGPKAQREALSLLDYATGDGRPQDRRVSLTLSVRKFFPASGRLGLLLDDEGGWTCPPKETRIGLMGRDITRHWAMTWVNVDGDWKLLTLAYVLGAPVSASGPMPSASPVPLVLVEDTLTTQPVTGEVLPQIRAYAAALDTGSLSGYRRLLAPDFRFKNRNDSEEKGQKALRDAESMVLIMRDVMDVTLVNDVPRTLTVHSDHSHSLSSHDVTITKFFQKPGTLVLFVTDAMTYKPALLTKFGRVPLNGSWEWKQTWVDTTSGWRLRQVTEF